MCGRISRYVLAGIALLCWRGVSQAQLVVADPPLETSAADIDLVQLPALIQQDAITAASVATPLPPGAFPYTPIPISFFINEQRALFQGVNAGSFCIGCSTNSADFVGWVDYIEGNAPSTPKAEQTVKDMLTTAQNAIGVSAAVSGTQVDTSGIAQAATSVNSLYALEQVHIATDLALADLYRLDIIQHAAQTAVESARLAEDINTRGQDRAHSANWFWRILGVD